MTGFVSTSKVTPLTESDDGGASVKSADFWPVIYLADLRKAKKLDGQVTTDRLMACAIQAVRHINNQLATWRAAQQVAGFAALQNVPAEEINDESERVWSYRDAVYSLTKALLIEGYRDIDTTRDGEKHAAALSTQIDTLWRDMRFNINDITGRPRQLAELV